MDSFLLARSIIGSNYAEGIQAYTAIKPNDPTEIVFMKLWLRYWFMGQEITEEEQEDLAVRTLHQLIEREVKK